MNEQRAGERDEEAADDTALHQRVQESERGLEAEGEAEDGRREPEHHGLRQPSEGEGGRTDPTEERERGGHGKGATSGTCVRQGFFFTQ